MKTVLCAACVLVLASAALAAQGSGTTLRGRVVEAVDTLQGIGAVEVEILGAGLRRSTDRDGSYLFVNVPEGAFDVTARFIGYKSDKKRVAVRNGETAVVNFQLSRVTQTLTEVTVEGRRLKVPARFGEVYERASHGWGKFFTREDIQARNPMDVKSLLSAIPSVLINDRGITFQRCQAGLPSPFNAATATKMSRNSIMDDVDGPERRPGNVQVYVDGIRMTRNNKAPDVPSSFQAQTEADVALESVPPSSIQAIEVYTGVTRIPAQFATDACAAIVIWTTSY